MVRVLLHRFLLYRFCLEKHMSSPEFKNFLRAVLLGACAIASSAPSVAAGPVKVGVALDISGPFASGGVEVRDGINLAAKLLGNKLGDQPAEFVQADTGGNPEQARQLVDRMIQREKIDLFTGPVSTPVALAVGPTLFDAKIPYLTVNAGPGPFAGAQCNAYFFGTSYQNDAPHEAGGQVAANRGFKKMVLVAPNYPAGKDALTGFKRMYKLPVAEEIFTKVGQLDFAAELAQIRSIRPDAVYIFEPGGMGINFIKQFMAAGLAKETVLISSPFTADEDIIPSVGDSMVGIYNASNWAHDLDNPANKRFVAEFRKAYAGRYPSIYAAYGYDVIMAMDAAVRQAGGKVDDREALVKALAKADFASVRGTLRYNTNHFAIQDFYLRQIVKDADGRVTNKLQPGKVLTAHADVYASRCPLK
jgi:branched-chain amino acid transport system substrate-binding protein